MLQKPETAKARYIRLTQLREPFLRRARDASELTIPTLMPPEGHTGSTTLPEPWQAMGAMGVNNLASKIIMALMPPNTPFFKLSMDDKTKKAIAQAGSDIEAEVGQIMSGFENSMMDDIEQKADRVAGFEMAKHLINDGNILVYVPPADTMRVYTLDQYVVKRDPRGNPLLIIVKECVSPMVLPDNLAAAAKVEADQSKRFDETVDVYTVIERQGRTHFNVWQEVCEQRVPGTEGVFPIDAMAYMPLRLLRTSGEDYGRGFVEEYLGDLRSLEGLQKAVVEAAAASAKVIILRNPSASTSAEDMSDAENGDIVDGLEQDFKILQANKFPDMQGAMQSIERLEARLAKAFLMVSSVQRNAERVTAEEIRVMAGDLEDSLGGIYSTLTLEFQLPYVKRKMHLLQLQGKLPHFPKGSVQPTVVTGLAALGRNHEVQKYMAWAQACSALVGPEEFAASINSDALFAIFGTGFGVQVDKIVKTAQQKQAEAQAQQRQQLTQAVAPEVVRNARQQQPAQQ